MSVKMANYTARVKNAHNNNNNLLYNEIDGNFYAFSCFMMKHDQKYDFSRTQNSVKFIIYPYFP